MSVLDEASGWVFILDNSITVNIRSSHHNVGQNTTEINCFNGYIFIKIVWQERVVNVKANKTCGLFEFF